MTEKNAKIRALCSKILNVSCARSKDVSDLALSTDITIGNEEISLPVFMLQQMADPDRAISLRLRRSTLL